MIRSLIVDDEMLARQRLRRLLGDHPDLEVVGECSDGLEAVRDIEALRPDLVFLDIQMPELDGFGVIEEVGPDRMPPTLFVTAYDQFALKAFEVHALDYLLKPFDPERFAAALARVRTWIQGSPRPSLEPMLKQIQADRPPPDRLLIKEGTRYAFVRPATIQWVEAEDNYVRLHVEGTSHLVRQTMGAMLDKLSPNRFRRIHRSAIVNLDFIRHLEPWTGGDYLVTMKDGSQLTMSRTYRNQLGEWL
ncbi:LytR/AlgR family response regulator transcription factor [Mesoterricola silvestris]|uniref:DNA-binding response regulator n=1 Tax=Mesoterricola silvestris TaxID=2927979 RepID=A0AA48GTD4_9BACT|nr:LytTR family DNA-binding domain-containing protein [Mesoterricola silvestris]BDU73980.1 DNA-binding response regulator [Mesoterricola silvestris]